MNGTCNGFYKSPTQYNELCVTQQYEDAKYKKERFLGILIQTVTLTRQILQKINNMFD